MNDEPADLPAKPRRKDTRPSAKFRDRDAVKKRVMRRKLDKTLPSYNMQLPLYKPMPLPALRAKQPNRVRLVNSHGDLNIAVTLLETDFPGWWWSMGWDLGSTDCAIGPSVDSPDIWMAYLPNKQFSEGFGVTNIR